MINSISAGFFGLLALEILAGLCPNIFIIISLIRSGKAEKYFGPYNIIVIVHCFSSIGTVIVMSVNVMISIVWSSLLSVPFIMYTVIYMSLYSLTLGAWLTCTLCFFYFVKIIPFQPGFLAWLKMKIDTLVPWIIPTVAIISLFGCFLVLIVYEQESPNNSTMNAAETSNKDKLRVQLMNRVLMTSSLPLLTSISIMAVCAWFLKQQSVHVKKNVRSAGVKEYTSAVQTLSCLLCLYALILLFMVIYNLPELNNQIWAYWMCLFVLYLFAPVKAGLLIAGNPKLKEALRQMLTCV